MSDVPNWVINTIPLLVIVVIWVFIMVWGKKWQSPYRKLIEKQTEVLEQQLTVLRETNELLKKLNQTRG